MSDNVGNNSAQQVGQGIYNAYFPLSTEECFCQLSDVDVDSVGGLQGWISIFARFYELFMADATLKGLFDYTNPDVAEMDPKVHGRRFGLWLLARHSTGQYSELYMRERGGHLFGNIGRAHERAINCPFRQKVPPGTRFTQEEYTTWLGFQKQAMEERGVPEELRDRLLKMYAGYGFKFIL